MVTQLTQGSAVWVEAHARCQHLQRLCEASSFGDLGMAQLVRCLLNNNKEQSSVPRTDVIKENLGVMVHTCNFSTREEGWIWHFAGQAA